MFPNTDAPSRCEVHLLDVGQTRFGDAMLCRFGSVSVLIDGGHPGDHEPRNEHRSIPEQIGKLLGQSEDALHVSLLIITHAHADHFGCLPSLVRSDRLRADWSLIADPALGW